MFRRSGPINPQTGQPPIAATATGPGTAAYRPQPPAEPWSPTRLFGGRPSWSDPGSPQSLQRGQPAGFGRGQENPKRQVRQQSGEATFVATPYYDGGAQMFAPQFATPFVNPIGAGVQVPYRTHSSYYGSGQYDAGVVFWTNRFVPTSIPPSALTDPAEIQAILSDLRVYQEIQVAP
jgi:hypothetical protein